MKRSLFFLIQLSAASVALAQSENPPDLFEPQPFSPVAYVPPPAQSITSAQMQVVLARINDIERKRQYIERNKRHFESINNRLIDTTPNRDQIAENGLKPILGKMESIKAELNKINPESPPNNSTVSQASVANLEARQSIEREISELGRALSKLERVFREEFGGIGELYERTQAIGEDPAENLTTRDTFDDFDYSSYKVKITRTRLPNTLDFQRKARSLLRSEQPNSFKQFDESMNSASKELKELNSDKLDSVISDTLWEYQRFDNDMITYLDNGLKECKINKAAASEELSQLSKVASRQGEINEKLVYAVYGMIAAIVLLFLTLRLFNPSQINEMIKGRTLIELLSMGFLLLTIIILGTGRLINAEGLSTILGAIAGYIFGRETDRRRSRSKSPEDSRVNKERSNSTGDASVQIPTDKASNPDQLLSVPRQNPAPPSSNTQTSRNPSEPTDLVERSSPAQSAQDLEGKQPSSESASQSAPIRQKADQVDDEPYDTETPQLQ